MIILTVKKLNRLQACLGLIGKNEPEPILFNTRFGIHTLFMRLPIDVVILDSKHNVVKTKENLKPNNVFIWNPFYNRVLELPQGTISEKKIELRSQIIIL